MPEFQDRRRETVPVVQERRLEERVAVLEVQVDNHATKLENNQEMLIKFFDRFDNHLERQTDLNKTLETTLVKVSTTVDNLTSEISRTNSTMEGFAQKIEKTTGKVNMWDTMGKTIAKVVSIAAIVVGALWTVYTFAVDHQPSVTQQTK